MSSWQYFFSFYSFFFFLSSFFFFSITWVRTRTCAQVVLAIRNTFLRCTSTMATKTSVGAEPGLSGDYRQLVVTLDGQLRAVMERISDLTDMELGFPHWQAKRRHEEALQLEAAAEV